MAQAIPKRPSLGEPVTSQVLQRVKEGVLIALGGVALFLLIALWSHHPSDPGWSHTGTADPIRNQCGIVGAWIADIALYLFGGFAYVFPLMIAFAGWVVFRERAEEAGWDYFHLSVRGVGFALTVGMGCGLIWVRARELVGELPYNAGGILGDVVGGVSFTVFGHLGGSLLMLAMFLTGITLFTGVSWLWLMDNLGHYTLRGFARARGGGRYANRLRAGAAGAPRTGCCGEGRSNKARAAYAGSYPTRDA